MSSPRKADLEDVALGAQLRGRDLRAADPEAQDLRGTLLLAQAEMFAGAPSYGPDVLGAFETLALGLIPLVDARTRSRLAARLATVPATPPAVMRALAGSERALDDEIRHGRLDGRRLAALVEVGRREAELARWLLARPEPTLFDRAALYRHAEAADRAEIRARLARRLPSPAVPRRALDQPTRADLLARGHSLALAAIMAAQGIGASTEAVAAGLDGDGDRELFVLGCLALGFSPEECVRIRLRLPPAVSRSVATVHALAGLARETPLAVARCLADPDDRIAALTEAGRSFSAYLAEGARGSGPRGARGLTRAAPADRERARPGASGLLDHRSTATTGPRRT